ncbi:MAG TPA: radical SAM protein [Vicinamibacterales bacterium]|nr:radical SAM protein [Vicinamibacterales bacterium]
MIPAAFDGIDPLGTAARSVTINLNNRCPLRCRHCSVGFSDNYAGDATTISAETLAATIAAIDQTLYDMALLAGGEPSLDPPLIRTAIEACRSTGLLCAIVTAPVWAATSATADRFMERVSGLDILILSYDEYHLEFIDVTQYERAIRAAAKARVSTIVHIVYTKEEDRSRLRDLLADVRHLVKFHDSRTVPFGNAADPHNVSMEQVVVNAVSDLDRIPRGCVLGNALVDDENNVHGCCWSRFVPGSPFSEATDARGLPAAFARLEDRPEFQSVRAHGFLGALTVGGRDALVRLVRGQGFANECHICLKAMTDSDSEIWKSCRDPYAREPRPVATPAGSLDPSK